MSGSSTLRICLAAMAPALTEAASARLKIQDPTPKDSPIKVNNKTKDLSLPVLKRDLNTLGIRNISTDLRVTHLARTNNEHNATNGIGDPKRSTSMSNGSSQTSPLSSNVSKFSNIKGLSIKVPHLDHYYASEDFQSVRDTKSDQYIDDFKIMNQPQVAADKNKEIKDQCIGNGDTFVNISNIKVLPPVMVNGDNDLDKRENSDNVKYCDESGDAPVKRSFHSISGSQDKEKLNSSVTMGMNMKHNQIPPQVAFESVSSVSETQPESKSKEDMRKDCIKKQLYLERKVDTLIRRLKRMKGKVVESHTKEQLRHFVNYQHKNLLNVAKTIKNEAPVPTELKEHFFSNEEVKNMSTPQLVKLVKTCQPNRLAMHEKSSSKANNIAIMDLSVRNTSLNTSEKLLQRVQMTASELDSDATASSSGGESGDEDLLQSPQQQSADLPPLIKRAEWKWAVDRGAVVSRWTWLQAQVSDLEYRIRQQSQIHRQLRNSKGGVVLGDPPTATEILKHIQGLQKHSGDEKVSEGAEESEVSPSNVSSIMSNVDKLSSRLAHSLGKCLSPSSAVGSPSGSSKISSPFANGLTDSPCSTTDTDTTTADDSPMIPKELRLSGKASHLLDSHLDSTCQAARCRPLRSYRKRKILRTMGLFKTSQKAARLSDIRCHCYSPANPCTVCGGRYNNTLTVDPDSMSVKERVAILDSSFHPVLSFPQDVHLPIHFEGLLKTGMWQNKPPSRKSRVGDYKRHKVHNLVAEPVKKNGNNRQNGRNNTSVINFSAKIKNKYDGKTKGNTTSKGASIKSCVNKKTKRKSVKVTKALKRHRYDLDNDDIEALFLEQETSMSNNREGGLSCSASQSSLKDMREGGHSRKRRVDNSFDINNIVIPLSMATTTRVEQPQYKEIVTPKWREIPKSLAQIESTEITQKLEKTNGVSIPVERHKVEVSSDEEPEEDLSDEKFAARHLVMEQEEKKFFRNFVQYPPLRRNRTSLPSTSSLEENLDNIQMLTARRRTISFSKRERSGSVLEDIHNSLIECNGVEPWPRRTFPLSEDEFELMSEELPPSCEPVHRRVARRLAEPSGKVYVGNSVDNQEDPSAAPSPHPSNESVSSLGEDPNDPEWIGVEVSKRCKIRKAINDDSNDPEWTGSDTPRKNKNKR